ncbi:hypothetical protein VM1G_07471 [Cytospora mali]|uniref:PD-(D/E)XK nuclease-like domain-containing protein n=1 Tax=Cytospora mali TaxID=578113 RepID=A0A194W5Y1_CYTMA|nr:hypothetical protein VM1G_07471 [Valsa mali]
MERVLDWLAFVQEAEHSQCRHHSPTKSAPYCTYTMPATPPESEHAPAPPIKDLTLESPPKKRVRQQDPDPDLDKTPKNILRRRPVLEPKPPSKRDRSPSPSSPIKGLADLNRLEKPVTIIPVVTAAGYETLQQAGAGLQDLYRSIRRVLRFGQFVPIEIQDEFSALIKHRGDEAEDGWFAPRQTRTRERHLEELGKLLDIHHEALEAVTLGRHEAAWNSAVHHPLLTMAFDEGSRQVTGEKVAEDLRLRVENVTSATIAGDCLPRLNLGMPRLQWTMKETGAADTPSIGAWSISQATTSTSTTASTTASSSGTSSRTGDLLGTKESRTRLDASDPFVQRHLHLDSTVHTKADSKKVDFAIVCVPKAGTALHTAIQAVLNHMESKPALSYSINPSTYGPLVEALIAITLETKTTSASRDPLIQLGLVAAAIHRRLHTLPVAGATGSSPLTKTGVIVPLPMVVVTNHQWDLYFAHDNGSSIQLIGPLELGSTASLVQIYMLLASLRLLKTWTLEVFCPAMEKWLTLREDEPVD